MSNLDLLRDIARAKAHFQLRTIAHLVGVQPHPSDETTASAKSAHKSTAGGGGVSDAELGEFLAPFRTSADQARLVCALSADQRALFEKMADACSRVALYEAGLGPKPTDVRLCGPNEIREGRGPRPRKKRAR